MADWLKIAAMIFYAPLRGLREARDRGGMLPAFVCAYIIQVAYVFLIHWIAGDRAILARGAGGAVNMMFSAVAPILTVAVVVVPVAILIANLFDRRGSFGVVLQQEYGSLVSIGFYVLSAASIFTLLIATLLHFSGFQAANVAAAAQSLDSEQMRAMTEAWQLTPEQIEQQRAMMANPVLVSLVLFEMFRWPLLAIGALLGLREVFRLSLLRSIAAVILIGFASLPLAGILYPIFGRVVGSPFLLLFLFFLLRGYFGEIVSSQRARAAFKQNLEAATINPRDSSAHYNLGLIHQNRGELDQARERFQRAIEIDPEELDAHYQLGRIARAQNRLVEAIGHFEEVVQRDQFHAQNEIWREIGATYIAAGQFADGREALQKFLERRENDPQGLYLMGRAHAGLGDNREAANSMRACIDAVKTAPAYKYRSEKRWLHEAQQFLKGKKQEPVGSRQ
jgi:tetratricopeptide (TPR) repeat protein